MKIEFNRNNIQSLAYQLSERLKIVKYRYKAVCVAGRNLEFPPVISILMRFLNKSYIPTEEELCHIVSLQQLVVPEGISRDQFIKDRCHSFYSSFLRELHFLVRLLELAPLSRVIKDDNLDMAFGIDFLYYPNEPTYLVEVPINIGHEGKDSKWHYENRKIKKQNGVVKLIAPLTKDDGVHFVSEESIRNFVNEYGT